MGLKLSPGILDGGVKRLPTLKLANPAGGAGIVDMGVNFPDRGGGGSSKAGRCDAAGLRAVKLDGAPIGSMFETMPGCCMTEVIL